MDIDYKCSGQNIHDLLKEFIYVEILKGEFTVDSPKESLLILDGKRYTQNKYTDAYLFDPFFSSLNFELKRKQGQFITNFQVVNPQKIELRLCKKDSPKYWLCDEEFIILIG